MTSVKELKWSFTLLRCQCAWTSKRPLSRGQTFCMQMCASACAIGRSVERGALGMETKPGNPTHAFPRNKTLGGHPDAELCNNCTSLVKHFFRTWGLAQLKLGHLLGTLRVPGCLANSQNPAPGAALRHSAFISVCTIVATYNIRFVGTGSKIRGRKYRYLRSISTVGRQLDESRRHDRTQGCWNSGGYRASPARQHRTNQYQPAPYQHKHIAAHWLLRRQVLVDYSNCILNGWPEHQLDDSSATGNAQGTRCLLAPRQTNPRAKPTCYVGCEYLQFLSKEFGHQVSPCPGMGGQGGSGVQFGGA